MQVHAFVTYQCLKLDLLPTWRVNEKHPSIIAGARRSKRSRAPYQAPSGDQGNEGQDDLEDAAQASLLSGPALDRSHAKQATSFAVHADASSRHAGMKPSLGQILASCQTVPQPQAFPHKQTQPQDQTLPQAALTFSNPEEEAMLFRLELIERVLATGTSGRVYFARYTPAAVSFLAFFWFACILIHSKPNLGVLKSCQMCVCWLQFCPQM